MAFKFQTIQPSDSFQAFEYRKCLVFGSSVYQVLPFNDQLVLLLISSRDDKVVFGADEPEKLFEPVSLSSLGH